MDPSLYLESQTIDEFFNSELDNGLTLEITDPHQKLAIGQSLEEPSIGGAHLLRNQPFQNGAVNSTSFVDTEDVNHNDRDLLDGALRYIDHILMEGDMESTTNMLQEPFDLQAKERSFYEILGKKYPPSPRQESTLDAQCGENPNNNDVNHHYSTTSTRDDSGYLIDVVDRSWHHTHKKYDAYPTDYISSNFTNVSSSNNLNSVMDQFSNSPMSPPQIGDMNCVISEVIRNFMKGVDDASKFLPSGSKMLGMNSVDNNAIKIKSSHFESRGKKHQHTEENDCEEERSKKMPAVDKESNVPIEEFNDIWIYSLGEREKELAAYMAQLQVSHHGKNQNRKTELIDLTYLLDNCAESIASGDHHSANELLKQIRQHSSPFGNVHQKLAHYFANGLEARLAGSGSEIYNALVHEKTAPEYVMAYSISLITSPLRKITNFSVNKTIMIKSEKATTIHVIDFGIFYGFQWPVFIKRVAKREGGPPKLRITGIDYPQPGSRPAERIEDTGRRLAHYAKMFNVPFEYNAIAQNWDTIKLEELKIEKGEFVAVTCTIRAMKLENETVVAESSRTTFLDLIRKMNPDIFIHGISNASYNSPFFVNRFREAFSCFSVAFDFLETLTPGAKSELMVMERDVLGKDILNVIACEGQERVERPETYKQWQVRHVKAGLMQVPFQRKLMDTITHKVKNFYPGDFAIDEDKQWLLISWKGKIFYAISCWQPV